jgi:hypothetical protein
MKIIVYSTINGDIFRNVYCPDGMEDLQCGENEAWLEHEYVDDSEYMVDLNTLEIIPIQ